MTPTTVLEQEPVEGGEEEVVVAPAYDLTHDNKVSFPCRATISVDEWDDMASIRVDAPSEVVSFEVPLTITDGHKSLDAEYITISGLAVMIYYKDIGDEFVSRRVFYYSHTTENGPVPNPYGRIEPRASKPSKPDWSRERDGYGDVEFELEGRVEVYDSRENMLTTKKPTPEWGEVVLRYSDPLYSTNGPGRVVNTIQTEITHPNKDFEVRYITVDPQSREYVFYAEAEEGDDYAIRFPIRLEASPEDMEWEPIGQVPNPFLMENVIWASDPIETWAIKGFDHTQMYRNSEENE